VPVSEEIDHGIVPRNPSNKGGHPSAERGEGSAWTKENARPSHMHPTYLTQIYEEDFRGFSYGFRPGRSPHQALDALSVALSRKRVNSVLVVTFGASLIRWPTNGWSSSSSIAWLILASSA
jgi:hypothetical protein